ncbi:MAG: hypothetical protein HOE75_01470 [Chloroflexi bacterium]|jgi:hypothetical protein|nr:hypothetical protein [Chloroflexota bacterium]
MCNNKDMETTTKTHEVQTDERIAQTYGEFLAATYDAPKSTDPRTLDEYAIWESAENEYDGWSRFFAVPGGHIHSSMNCSTCNRVTNQSGQTFTAFAWLPALSGLTAADAIAAHGHALCSVCFPNAPVSDTNKSVKIADPVQEALAARRERNIAEAQARYEAAITPELDALVVAFIEAEAAQKAYTRTVEPSEWYQGPAFEASKAAYAALNAGMPEGFDFYTRAKDLGVR